MLCVVDCILYSLNMYILLLIIYGLQMSLISHLNKAVETFLENLCAFTPLFMLFFLSFLRQLHHDAI